MESIGQVAASREAGGKVIRGGTLRTLGYLVGVLLMAAASVVILRYLGVVDFGRYVTVMAVLAIVGGLTDAGLTVVGQREYTVRESVAERRVLLSSLVGIRLALTPLGVALAVAFVAVAGYGETMVLGTLVGGIGLVILNAAATLTLPLSVDLRLGTLTVTEVAKQGVFVAGFLAAVAAGAGLVAFFGVQVLAGIAVLVLTLALVGPAARLGPRFRWAEWRPLLVEAWPIAVASVVNVIYVRILVVMISLIAAGVQTGLFATSYRVVEIFVGIPVLMVGAAFPVLAHAGAVDEERLAYALQRLGEVAFLVAAAIAVVLVLGARPIIQALGGEDYLDAAPVLRIQALALLGAFMTQVWLLGLVAVRRQRALIATNAVALVTVLALGLALIPPDGARGAAIAAAAGEAVLAVTTLTMLVRARPALRPALGYMAKLTAAGAAAVGLGYLLPVGDVAATVIGGIAFSVAAIATRSVPAEIGQALLRRGGPVA